MYLGIQPLPGSTGWLLVCNICQYMVPLWSVHQVYEYYTHRSSVLYYLLIFNVNMYLTYIHMYICT